MATARIADLSLHQYRQLMTPALYQLESEFPGITFQLAENHAEDCLEVLANGRIRIGSFQRGQPTVESLREMREQLAQMPAAANAQNPYADAAQGRQIFPGLAARLFDEEFQVATAHLTQQPRPRPTEDAEARAKELLYSYLTPIQTHTLKTFHYFDVVGERSGKTYRIREEHGRNVYLIHKGERCGAFDARPYNVLGNAHGVRDTFHLPMGDILLAQKLALETDERSFIRLACWSPMNMDGPVQRAIVLGYPVPEKKRSHLDTALIIPRIVSLVILCADLGILALSVTRLIIRAYG